MEYLVSLVLGIQYSRPFFLARTSSKKIRYIVYDIIFRKLYNYLCVIDRLLGTKHGLERASGESILRVTSAWTFTYSKQLPTRQWLIH